MPKANEFSRYFSPTIYDIRIVPNTREILCKENIPYFKTRITAIEHKHVILRLSWISALRFDNIRYVTITEIYTRNLHLMNTIFHDICDQGNYLDILKTVMYIVIPKIEKQTLESLVSTSQFVRYYT
jgi:hypothetical protein